MAASSAGAAATPVHDMASPSAMAAKTKCFPMDRPPRSKKNNGFRPSLRSGRRLHSFCQSKQSAMHVLTSEVHAVPMARQQPLEPVLPKSLEGALQFAPRIPASISKSRQVTLGPVPSEGVPGKEEFLARKKD